MNSIKVPKQLFRAGTMEKSEDGSIRLSISSEDPYRRFDWWTGKEYYEVIDHSEGAIDISRLKNGAPLLYNHDRNVMLGTLSNPMCENGRCYVDARMSQAPDCESFRVKVAEGILKDTSIGYTIEDEGEKVGEKDGIPVLKFKTKIFEASLVTVPADPSVGVGRMRKMDEKDLVEIAVRGGALDNGNETEETTRTHMSEPAAPQIDIKEVASKAVEAEQKRRNEILDLSNHFKTNGLAGRKIDTSELAEQFVRENKTAADFQNAVVRGNFPEVKPVVAPTLGMNEKEKREFSFARAIWHLGTGRGLSGLEKEASEAHGKLIGAECPPNSFYVPQDIMRGSPFPRGISREQALSIAASGSEMTRALFSNVYSGAGAFVADNMIPTLIELLRNQMMVVRMGARTLSGLTGNVPIPRQTGGATASWLAEDSTITASQQTVGQLTLSPHKLAAATAFSEQLVMQSSIDVENFVRQDLMAVTAIARDLAAIAGTGVSGQPLGILNLSSTDLSTSVTLSAAQSMTYANAVQFETNVSLNNAAQGRLGYLATPTVKGNAKLVAEISAANSVPVWKNDMVNGYPAFATNQVPTATSVIFGNWDDLILADWAQSSFFVDPYSLSLQGQIRVINRLYCDNGVRHAKSFSVSTN